MSHQCVYTSRQRAPTTCEFGLRSDLLPSCITQPISSYPISTISTHCSKISSFFSPGICVGRRRLGPVRHPRHPHSIQRRTFHQVQRIMTRKKIVCASQRRRAPTAFWVQHKIEPHICAKRPVRTSFEQYSTAKWPSSGTPPYPPPVHRVAATAGHV